VRRALPVLASALTLVGCGAAKTVVATSPGTTVTAPVASTTTAGCASLRQAGIAAVFGDRRTEAAAAALEARAQHNGFQGLTVERRGCRDYAVVLYGLQSLRQAREFRAEAASVGYRVRLECRSHPSQGGLAAVFGHRRTKQAALRLQARAERQGFLGLQVQQDRCGEWEVDLYGLQTPAQRHEFAAEARREGFHVTYERG
jgi:cell division septation protein DedD